MWIATAGDQMLSSYTIDLSNGAVSSARSSVASGPSPSTMALTPDGSLLFVADSDGVHIFNVNTSDGTVTASTATPLQVGNPAAGAVALAIEPTGNFLFATNQGNAGVIGTTGAVPGSIAVFKIASGTVSAVTGSPFPSALSGDVTGNGPSGLAVTSISSSNVGYVYVADQFSNVIAAYSYDTTGVPTFLNSYPAPTNPTGLAFSRPVSNSTRDNFLMVAETGSDQVRVFSACVAVTLNCASATGLLSPAGSPVGAATRPIVVLPDPAFDFVYVINQGSNQISQYTFGAATGQLTALSPTNISTGSSPVSGGVTRDGNWVYTANNGASNLSALGVSSTGKLSPANTATVILSNQPSGILVR